MPQTYEGGCHCGRVRFRVTADLDRVTNCNCSICTKKGFLHLIVARDQFELVSGKDDLTTYRFNTGVAQHTFCKHCGMHPFYVPRSDPTRSTSTRAAWKASTSPQFRSKNSTAATGRPRLINRFPGAERIAHRLVSLLRQD